MQECGLKWHESIEIFQKVIQLGKDARWNPLLSLTGFFWGGNSNVCHCCQHMQQCSITVIRKFIIIMNK